MKTSRVTMSFFSSVSAENNHKVHLNQLSSEELCAAGEKDLVVAKLILSTPEFLDHLGMNRPDILFTMAEKNIRGAPCSGEIHRYYRGEYLFRLTMAHSEVRDTVANNEKLLNRLAEDLRYKLTSQNNYKSCSYAFGAHGD